MNRAGGAPVPGWLATVAVGLAAMLGIGLLFYGLLGLEYSGGAFLVAIAEILVGLALTLAVARYALGPRAPHR